MEPKGRDTMQNQPPDRGAEQPHGRAGLRGTHNEVRTNMPQHKIYVTDEKYEQYRKLSSEDRERVNKAAQRAWYQEMDQMKR